MAKPEKKAKSKASAKPTMRELSKTGAKKKRNIKGRSLISSALSRKPRSEKKKRKTLKLPNNRFGKILDAIIFTLPRYLRGSWQEIRLTTWPSRKETIRLTFAVFIFSTAFAVFVSVLDFALDKIFKHLITK
jgi:preprotein translocase SecE subunit